MTKARKIERTNYLKKEKILLILHLAVLEVSLP